jgi:LacI family transcriptional regulator
MEAGSPRRRVTIADVADRANVSRAAVSKVLRNAYGVSPAMRARVRQAMTDLSYRPHAAARGMRGQTYTIGVMLPDIRNPFFPDIIDGVSEQLSGSDYQVLIGAGGGDPDSDARVTDAMILELDARPQRPVEHARRDRAADYHGARPDPGVEALRDVRDLG